MKLTILLLSCLFVNMILCEPTLNLVWLQFPPCTILSDWLSTHPFPNATVTVTCVDISVWHSSIFDDYALGPAGRYELAGLDSQWIGEAVTAGYLQEITSFVLGELDPSDYYPAPLASYGEYPPNSGEYFGVPFEPDVQVLLYRKDVFAQLNLVDPFSQTELLNLSRTINDANIGISGYTGLWCSDPVCYVCFLFIIIYLLFIILIHFLFIYIFF